MFEGIPHIAQGAPDLYLFTLTLVTACLIMWIRQGFLKEWRLRNYLKNNMNRIWQRGADEVPQAEGIAINHLIGVLTFGIMAWSSLGFVVGVCAGAGFIASRQLMFRIAGAFPKTSQLGRISLYTRDYMFANPPVLLDKSSLHFCHNMDYFWAI